PTDARKAWITEKGGPEKAPWERYRLSVAQNGDVSGDEGGGRSGRSFVNRPPAPRGNTSSSTNQYEYHADESPVRHRESRRQVSMREEVDVVYIPDRDEIRREERAARRSCTEVRYGGNGRYPSTSSNYTPFPTQLPAYTESPGFGYYSPTPFNNLYHTDSGLGANNQGRFVESMVLNGLDANGAPSSSASGYNPSSHNGPSEYRPQATFQVVKYNRGPTDVRTKAHPRPNKHGIRRAILGGPTEIGWENEGAMVDPVWRLKIWAKVPEGWAKVIITAPTNRYVVVHDVVFALNSINVPELGTQRESEELDEVFARMFGER
ncbi:hypothetical protein H0H87_009125, partial [Tephrocybe sp. NHM501043]